MTFAHVQATYPDASWNHDSYRFGGKAAFNRTVRSLAADHSPPLYLRSAAAPAQIARIRRSTNSQPRCSDNERDDTLMAMELAGGRCADSPCVALSEAKEQAHAAAHSSLARRPSHLDLGSKTREG